MIDLPSRSRILTGRIWNSGADRLVSKRSTEPFDLGSGLRFVPRFHSHVRVPWCFATVEVLLSLTGRDRDSLAPERRRASGAVREVTPVRLPRIACRQREFSAALARDGETRRIATRPTLIVGAGVLTRGRSSGGPSSLVRKTDASCALAPRRVASSETAREAVRRSAVETARSRRALFPGAAVLSAFAERRLGRRSGKLAMFSPSTRGSHVAPMEESAFWSELLSVLRSKRVDYSARITLQGYAKLHISAAVLSRPGRRPAQTATT